MKIFADCADLSVMKSVKDTVDGFTTNPTLMRAAGVADYESFAHKCVKRFPGHSLSFEVIADDEASMSIQAKRITSWGENVYVKIPVTTTNGSSTVELAHDLSHAGVKINVTAIFTQAQVNCFGEALRGGAPAYMSIFAGRIADTGRDPVVLVRNATRHARQNVDILWASTREVFNIKQAEDAGANIVTVTPDLLAKYRQSSGKDLDEFSLETVKMFRDDALAAGLTL